MNELLKAIDDAPLQLEHKPACDWAVEEPKVLEFPGHAVSPFADANESAEVVTVGDLRNATAYMPEDAEVVIRVNRESIPELLPLILTGGCPTATHVDNTDEGMHSAAVVFDLVDEAIERGYDLEDAMEYVESRSVPKPVLVIEIG